MFTFHDIIWDSNVKYYYYYCYYYDHHHYYIVLNCYSCIIKALFVLQHSMVLLHLDVIHMFNQVAVSSEACFVCENQHMYHVCHANIKV